MATRHLPLLLLWLCAQQQLIWAIRTLHEEVQSSPLPEVLNLRPLIGVMSQPGGQAPSGSTYIDASYIKWIEAAGARPVPILADMSKQEVERRFRAVNGLLIPGGSQKLRPGRQYFDTAAQLFNLAKQANQQRDFFPIHGTCLGFEALAIIVSSNTSILGDYDAEDFPAPLLPTAGAEDSRLYQALPRQVTSDLANHAYAMENHIRGIASEALQENPALGDFFRVLDLSTDRGGKLYVSTMESKDAGFPVVATQWHPEKNPFVWRRDRHVPHEPGAIAASQAMGNYLVSLARRSTHKPVDDAEELELLLYNTEPTYTAKSGSGFQEVYIFGPAKV